MKCKHIIWDQGQLLHIHKAWCGEGAGCRRLPYTIQGGRKCVSETPSQLPARSISQWDPVTQPWAWLLWCLAPGHSGGHEPQWDGLGEVGSDDQDFQPPWTSAGAVGAQNLWHPAMSSAQLEGASNGHGGVEVTSTPLELKHLLSKQRIPHSKEHQQKPVIKLMTAWSTPTKSCSDGDDALQSLKLSSTLTLHSLILCCLAQHQLRLRFSSWYKSRWKSEIEHFSLLQRLEKFFKFL